ncbi:hypothetical protein GCM10027417_05860 [Glutamicibacter endophyticus]
MTSPRLAVSTATGRMYRRDLSQPATVPSITTVMSVAAPDLSGWAGYLAATTLSEDSRLPEALQTPGAVRPLVREAASAAERFRDAAAERGDRLHNYAEAWALRALGQAHELEAARAKLEDHGELANAAHFEAWWRDYGVEPVAAEVTIWNATLGYAGTIDLVARIGGRLCLVDYKTRGVDRDGQLKRPDEKVVMQLAAAAQAEEQNVDAEAGRWEPWPHPRNPLLLAVALGAAPARTYLATEAAVPTYFAQFQALHAAWQARQIIATNPSALTEIAPPAAPA